MKIENTEHFLVLLDLCMINYSPLSSIHPEIILCLLFRSEHQHISSTSTDTWRQVTTQDHMNQNLTVGPSNNPSDKEQNIFNKISSGSQPDKEVDLTAGPTALSQERKTEELQQSYPTSSEGNQISEDSPSRSLQSIRLRRLQALSRSSLQDSSSAPSTPIQDKDESSK